MFVLSVIQEIIPQGVDSMLDILTMAVVVEALTWLTLDPDLIFHRLIWSKVQAKFELIPNQREYFIEKILGETICSYLFQLSKCNYCISFWISVLLCICAFDFTWSLILTIIIVWRVSHYLDTLYRYLLIRSFTVGDITVEE